MNQADGRKWWQITPTFDWPPNYPLQPVRAGAAVVHGNLQAGTRYPGSLTVAGVNTLHTSPFPIARKMIVDAIAFDYDLGAVGDRVRIGLYTDDGAGYPATNLADSGILVTEQNGLTTVIAPISAITLKAGRKPYWIAAVTNSATLRFSEHGDSYISILGGADQRTLAARVSVAQAYGALPAVFPAGGTYATKLWGFGLRVTNLL